MIRTANELHRSSADTLTRLLATHARLVAAHRALTEALPGYPTSTGGAGGSSLGADGTPAGLDRHVLGSDAAAVDLDRLDRIVRSLRNNSIELAAVVDRWLATTVVADSEPSRGADCLGCTRYVSNTTDADRLRSGLCPACYRSLRRSTLDRGDWLLERRRTVDDAA